LRFLGAVGLVGEAVQETTSAESTFVSSSGRTGVGRAIMSTLESAIVKRGHESATLDSSPNAVGFYVKLGYAPVGPPDGDGAVPMKKVLRVPDP
jgi:Acetyltransferase (GNAT) domain